MKPMMKSMMKPMQYVIGVKRSRPVWTALLVLSLVTAALVAAAPVAGAVILASNTFEGGTAGAVITPANSGGASGTAFDAVAGAVTFSSTHPGHGALGMRVPVCTTACSPAYVEWSTSVGAQTEVYGRVYLYLTKFPDGQGLRLFRQLNGTANTAKIVITAQGKLALENAVGTTVQTGTQSVALNQLVRIEFRIKNGATTGVIEAKLFNAAESTMPTETVTKTSANTGTQATHYRFGQGTPNTADATWLDDVALGTGGYLGPVAVGPTATPSATAT